MARKKGIKYVVKVPNGPLFSKTLRAMYTSMYGKVKVTVDNKKETVTIIQHDGVNICDLIDRVLDKTGGQYVPNA